VAIQKEGNGQSIFTLESADSDLREAVFDVAVRERWPLLQLTPESFSLEDVFRQLTLQ
jgi:hypothetical protein